MVVNFSCKICCKPVVKNHDGMQCNKRDTWVHRNCNKINKKTYRLITKRSKFTLSLHNFHQTLSAIDLNNDELIHTVKGKKVKFTHVTKMKVTAEASFFHLINCNLNANLGKYYLPSDFKQIKMNIKNNLNSFHFNISSLWYQFLELHTLLAATKTELDIIGIAESRLKSNKAI